MTQVLYIPQITDKTHTHTHTHGLLAQTTILSSPKHKRKFHVWSTRLKYKFVGKKRTLKQITFQVMLQSYQPSSTL